ncbi:hypothetical protein [Beggiatoa leptomitoformis]|uniref:Uncharacterized protein n=1 Tax=Beggiatoa leptomitoformis TaxID=288004 RepID=A0A2N9YBP6_9GAMM|nr:hypothetical protein [Beggiatoa leptomitoformis]ALG66763.1 hypothetical protein AL038_02345 [Beggiatoa leptomitoformis]AUI67893.1 hypothetical protein BLE401_03695 [Beggiatoa leptomitoformis]
MITKQVQTLMQITGLSLQGLVQSGLVDEVVIEYKVTFNGLNKLDEFLRSQHSKSSKRSKRLATAK